MNALKTLDGLIHDAATNVSRHEGNQLIIKEDGIYYQANIEYQDGIITFKVNGNIVKTIPLGLSTLVENAYYEANSEEIVIVVKLLNGDKQTIRIPVSALIREWDVDNNGPTKVVELTREEIINGSDRLSADEQGTCTVAGNPLPVGSGTFYADTGNPDISFCGELLHHTEESDGRGGKLVEVQCEDIPGDGCEAQKACRYSYGWKCGCNCSGADYRIDGAGGLCKPL